VSSFLRGRLLIIFLAAAVASSAAATNLSLDPIPDEGMAAIEARQLRMHLEFLASKELGGRYTLSPSFQIAARYLATRLEGYGYQGAARHGSFFQQFEVKTSRVDPDKSSMIVTLNGRPAIYQYGQFFNAGGEGKVADGEVVFAGYGISSPRQKHDDYSGLDVRGKIVVIAPGKPKDVDNSRLEDTEKEAGAAQRHGAIALVYLPRGYEEQTMKTQSYRDRSLENVRLAVDGEDIPVVRINPEIARRLLQTVGLDFGDIFARQKKGLPLAPQPLRGRIKVDLALTSRTDTTQNVVGILPGSDPAARDEYVTFSAHYDHLRTDSKGQIYPGADDDGSGTASVLAIAEAMALKRPKRSILIIFHAGEELGLLGSEYNSDFAPIVPLKQMVVDFNIDMIGRSRLPNDNKVENQQLTPADTIYVIGADRTSKELQQISEQTNRDSEKLTFDYLLNDPLHPDQIFYRSDHWNYGKHGVPFIFYFDGVSEDYHRPTDTLDKIDYRKMIRVTRLVYATGWRVANLGRRITSAYAD
jgi:hypothetical protein